MCVYWVSIEAAHQAVQSPSQKVHGPHLHGRHLRHVDGRAQVQVQEVSQQVALAGDDVRLVHGGSRPSAHWALARVDAVGGVHRVAVLQLRNEQKPPD